MKNVTKQFVAAALFGCASSASVAAGLGQIHFTPFAMDQAPVWRAPVVIKFPPPPPPEILIAPPVIPLQICTFEQGPGDIFIRRCN